MHHLALVAATGVLSGACDLQTKHWATQELGHGGTLEVWKPWVQLKLAYNQGTAFSMIRDVGDGRYVLAAIAIAFIVGLLVIAWKTRAETSIPFVAMGLLIGGGLGNLYDRLAREGQGVVDFIAVTLPGGFRWPTFNVADALLVIGAALLLLTAWRDKNESPPPEPAPGT